MLHRNETNEYISLEALDRDKLRDEISLAHVSLKKWWWIKLVIISLITSSQYIYCFIQFSRVVSGNGTDISVRSVFLTPSHPRMAILQTLAQVIDNHRIAEFGRDLRSLRGRMEEPARPCKAPCSACYMLVLIRCKWQFLAEVMLMWQYSMVIK